MLLELPLTLSCPQLQGPVFLILVCRSKGGIYTGWLRIKWRLGRCGWSRQRWPRRRKTRKPEKEKKGQYLGELLIHARVLGSSRERVVAAGEQLSGLALWPLVPLRQIEAMVSPTAL